MALARSPAAGSARPVPHRGRGRLRWRAVALAAFAMPPASAQGLRGSLDVKPGQEVAIPVTVADGAVSLGPARIAKAGLPAPKEGEIAVSLVKRGLSPYAELTTAEKVAAPIDFVATGLIGNIKIDEVKVCGRSDGTAVERIASGSWRVSLNSFTVRAAGQDCRR